MRKLTAFTIIMAVILSSFTYTCVEASTSMSGVISQDTVWTKANSPYTLTAKTLVSNGVTLTIEPGVTVEMNGEVYLQIDGTLNARGTSNEKINFNGGQLKFTEKCTHWNEQTQTGCIIENAVINSPLDLGVKITQTAIKLNADTVNTRIQTAEDSSIISNCSLVGIRIMGGATTITGNTITKNGVEFSGYGNGYLNTIIRGNTISDCEADGIYIETGNGLGEGNNLSILIEKNQIINNKQQGINVIAMMTPTIRYNTIAHNNVGIALLDYSTEAKVNYNNIYGNTAHNLVLNRWIQSGVDATYNWWGTTDEAAINQTIQDFYDDFDLGKVTYTPFLTEPNTNAPSYGTAPTAAPAPTETTRPPTEPTYTPNPYVSSAPTTSEPSAVKGSTLESTPLINTESIVIIAVIAFGVILVAFLVLSNRRNTKK